MKIILSLNDYEVFKFEVDEANDTASSCWTLFALASIPAGLIEAIEEFSRRERDRRVSATKKMIEKQLNPV